MFQRPRPAKPRMEGRQYSLQLQTEAGLVRYLLQIRHKYAGSLTYTEQSNVRASGFPSLVFDHLASANS